MCMWHTHVCTHNHIQFHFHFCLFAFCLQLLLFGGLLSVKLKMLLHLEHTNLCPWWFPACSDHQELHPQGSAFPTSTYLDPVGANPWRPRRKTLPLRQTCRCTGRGKWYSAHSLWEVWCPDHEASPLWSEWPFPASPPIYTLYSCLFPDLSVGLWGRTLGLCYCLFDRKGKRFRRRETVCSRTTASTKKRTSAGVRSSAASSTFAWQSWTSIAPGKPLGCHDVTSVPGGWNRRRCTDSTRRPPWNGRFSLWALGRSVLSCPGVDRPAQSQIVALGSSCLQTAHLKMQFLGTKRRLQTCWTADVYKQYREIASAVPCLKSKNSNGADTHTHTHTHIASHLLTLNVLYHSTPHWLRWKTCTAYRTLVRQILKWMRVCFSSCLLQEIPLTNQSFKPNWAIICSVRTGNGFGVLKKMSPGS